MDKHTKCKFQIPFPKIPLLWLCSYLIEYINRNIVVDLRSENVCPTGHPHTYTPHTDISMRHVQIIQDSTKHLCFPERPSMDLIVLALLRQSQMIRNLGDCLIWFHKWAQWNWASQCQVLTQPVYKLAVSSELLLSQVQRETVSVEWQSITSSELCEGSAATEIYMCILAWRKTVVTSVKWRLCIIETVFANWQNIEQENNQL
jgi:hypothetical protein